MVSAPIGPGARHQHALAEQRAGALGGMQADRERLGEGGLGRRDARRDLHRLPLLDDEHVAEAALHMREAHRAAVEQHVGAVLLLAHLAVAAMAAGPARIDRDAVARLHARDLAADRLDPAGDLMAEDHRLAHADRAEAAMQIVVQVRAADAAGLDPHAHVARPELGRGRRLDAQVLLGMDDDGTHGDAPESPREARPAAIV